MMKMRQIFRFLTLSALFFAGGISSYGQIALEYTDTTICPGNTIQMCASLTGHADQLNNDDGYSGIINIGFPFTFFGKTYTKCVASGNGFITFDSTRANGYGPWQYGQTPADERNAIFAAFVDLYLPDGGKIRYQHFGSPGSRKFVIEWCHLPFFIGSACAGLIATTQIILYEGSNTIEIHTTQLPAITPPCPTASVNNRVVQGVEDPTGTLTYFTTDRDPSGPIATNWGNVGVTDDGIRYTPNGVSTYMIDTIPFNPWIIIDSVSSADLKWYAPNQPTVPFTTGACATVTPNGSQNYYLVKFNGNGGCENDFVNLVDTVFIHYGTTYDTINVSICSGESYPFFGRPLYTSGQYDTLFTSSEGCDSSVTLNLTVNPLPNVTLKGSRDVAICEGAAAVLALESPEPTTTYQWHKDGAPVAGATSSKITVDEAGKYSVTATTDRGCELTSATFTVVVNPRPSAKINPLPDELMCAYDTLKLSAQTGNNYDYRWSPEKPFRQTGSAEGQEVTGVFINPQTDVVLTVYNEFGCYDHDTVTVLTKPCCEVFTPNAFTPNNDGKNDYFKPHLQLGQILLNMKIFDRLGQLVYDNRTPETGWDGTYPNGTPAAAGSYMYYIQYTCADGKLYQKKEAVALIR